MSYVRVPPAYFYAQQPETLYHEGSRGWEQAPVPGWGANPADAWPAQQAVNGLGADPAAPARFTYIGQVPQQNYIRVGIAPWGNFAKGPAYAYPKETPCPSCVGWPFAPGIGSIVTASRALDHGNIGAAVRAAMQGLGEGCGPCRISTGSACQTCPNDSDLPECVGCVDGQPEPVKRPLLEHPLAGPVIVGVATTLAASIALYFAKRAKVPVA